MADITNTPCRMDEYQRAQYACGVGLTILGRSVADPRREKLWGESQLAGNGLIG